ncbi:MAG: hypothetical protein KOO60_12725 [Gemmatimonadales bacterium]|nr:hypothetical protein [Gemmatimonadales bacterium]
MGFFPFKIGLLGSVFIALNIGVCQADQLLIAPNSLTPPVIDGKGNDPAWSQVPGITTHDTVAEIPLELKAVHSGDNIYFLVRYPDSDESNSHRSWVWNQNLGTYKAGHNREDIFVFKWFLNGDDSDLTLSSPGPYTADVWYWKACRTNPEGYADDKIQRLSLEPMDHARRILSKTGETNFLIRLGDQGTPAYQSRVVVTNQGPIIPRFDLKKPTGSRADVQAKGVWTDGYWVIEFRRNLRTGHTDDLQMDIGRSYRFGVSRYEISGLDVVPESDQPKFWCGEISEIITLEFTRNGKDKAW